MSERILKALMQLFAIIAVPGKNVDDKKRVVEDFLNQELNKDLVQEYLNLYLNYLSEHLKKTKVSRRQKVVSVNSVKVLMICNVINQELTQKQKFIVLIRLLEFINIDRSITAEELDFVNTVADSFNIYKEEYEQLKNFILYSYKRIPDSDRILIIDSDEGFRHPRIKHLFSESIIGQIIVFHIRKANMHIFYFQGEKELYLNGQLLIPNRIYVMSFGSSIRNSKIKPIYYSDIVSAYNADKIKSRIVFETDNLEYRFRNGKIGLHKMSFIERSGKLVGIMGVSGSGKTTLLNVLSGIYKPSAGRVFVNGIDLHSGDKSLEGLIGYVAQDDLLIEELTVFQNLYYNAKLCFDDYDNFKLYRVVLKMLRNLGLYEIKDMVVGNPLNKKISGGQRKRLNIALELIREPAILFLDEPTSGLSSRDSENIMDLLKELTLRGKLVFVVIHQPSSDIFKMFDRLLVLDTGGYLIYSGNPIDSIIYFKSRTRLANWNDSECPVCGNVNPDQIFNIVESRVIDEYGNPTQVRKIPPKEWQNYYLDYIKLNKPKPVLVRKLPEINFKIPNKFKQFKVFVKRDILAKFTNIQYIIINLFEAPLLALILSYIIKYYSVDKKTFIGYTLLENKNLPVYIFMSVIIALFIGLTVSAQEIIKDRKILKREAFLNLSRSSYLWSKVIILMAISAFQSITYVLIGNAIMEIPDMTFEYWIVLFSTWVFANLLGLNISDGFKTTVTIYIIIPFLIIPQIILSGVLVSYDKLNPNISNPTKIPWYGEIITARWAYEALAVHQYVHNAYMEPIYEYERVKSEAIYARSQVITSLENIANSAIRHINDKNKLEEMSDDFELLRNEIKKEADENHVILMNLNLDNYRPEHITKQNIDSLIRYLKALRVYYNKIFRKAETLENEYIKSIEEKPGGKEYYIELQRRNFNTELKKIVTNEAEQKFAILYKNKFYRKYQPIYMLPDGNFLKAHFYAPVKPFFDYYVETLWVNVAVIWIQTLILFLLLYFGVLRKLFEYFEEFSFKLKQKEIRYAASRRYNIRRKIRRFFLRIFINFKKKIKIK